jgi:hypothetical protein
VYTDHRKTNDEESARRQLVPRPFEAQRKRDRQDIKPAPCAVAIGATGLPADANAVPVKIV